MRSRSQNQNDDPHLSREELRTVLVFWLFWSVYVCLSTVLIAALLTGWPEFLHSSNPFFK
jgi:hypothetical protein